MNASDCTPSNGESVSEEPTPEERVLRATVLTEIDAISSELSLAWEHRSELELDDLEAAVVRVRCQLQLVEAMLATREQ